MHDPFPFIVGCGRSGTTLLRVMFDAHPQLAVPPESYFPLDPPAAWFGSDGGLDARTAATDLVGRWWLARWAIDGPAFVDAVAESAPRAYPDLIRELFAFQAQARGKPRYGNKTPKHVLRMHKIAGMFPEARFVHLVRDGRDVAMSLQEVDFGPTDLPGAARFWKGRVDKGREVGERLGPQRYLEVRYEDLIADPEGTLRVVCPFLDLPFDEAMLQYRDRGAEAIAAVGVPGKHEHLVEPPTKGLRDWRTQMVPSDVAWFEQIAGTSLDRFGYERSGISPSRSSRVRFGALDVASSARRKVADVRHRRARPVAEVDRRG